MQQSNGDALDERARTKFRKYLHVNPKNCTDSIFTSIGWNMLLVVYKLVDVDDHPHYQSYDDHPHQSYNDHPQYQAYDDSYAAPHSDYGTVLHLCSTWISISNSSALMFFSLSNKFNITIEYHYHHLKPEHLHLHHDDGLFDLKPFKLFNRKHTNW